MKLMNINSEACEETRRKYPTKNFKLDHIYVSIYVFAIFDTVPCWYEHIQPQKEINVPPTKGLQQVSAYW